MPGRLSGTSVASARTASCILTSQAPSLRAKEVANDKTAARIWLICSLLALVIAVWLPPPLSAGESQSSSQTSGQSAPQQHSLDPSLHPSQDSQSVSQAFFHGRTLSLTECLKIGEDRHPDLAASRAIIEQSEFQLKAARSNYLPRLDFGGSYSRASYNFAPSTGQSPTQFNAFYKGESFASAPYYASGLNFSQTVYDFGRTRGAVERGEAQLEASRRNLDRTRDIVDLNVRSAFFAVLAAEELVRIETEAVNNQQKHLDQIQAFFEVGSRPKIDVTNQEVALANAQVSLRQAQANLEVARGALATAMGIPIEESPQPARDSLNALKEELAAEPLDRLIAEAERDRPDVLALREQVNAAEADVVTARANTKPNLTLGSFFDYRNLKFPLIYNWSLAGLVAQNLFSGGLYRAEMGQASAAVVAARANLSSLIDQVRQQVFTAYSTRNVSRDKIGLAQKAEQAAAENLALAEGRYQAGYGNIIELTDAQTLYTDSQAQVITNRLDYQIAAAQLDTAVARRRTVQ